MHHDDATFLFHLVAVLIETKRREAAEAGRHCGRASDAGRFTAVGKAELQHGRLRRSGGIVRSNEKLRQTEREIKRFGGEAEKGEAARGFF